MSLPVYIGHPWGVTSVALAEGEGIDLPKVSSAVSIGPNTVRVTFDRAMKMGYDLSLSSTTLSSSSYTVRHIGSGQYLSVIQVRSYSDVAVDLVTTDQVGEAYEVTCLSAQDSYGNQIDLLNNTASFMGTGYSYETTEDLGFFSGLIGGVQYGTVSGISPDVNAPVVQNMDPGSLETGVPKDHTVYLEVVDAEDTVSLSTVRIYILGFLAYDGSTDTFNAPYSGVHASLGNGYSFTISRSSYWPSYSNIPVRTIAEDLSGNSCDYTYQFTIEDYELPTFENAFPISYPVSKSTVVSVSIWDDGGSGVSIGTINATIDAAVAILNGEFQSGFSGSIVPNGHNGFDVSIYRTALYGSYEWIDVVISAEDFGGNFNSTGWSFQVEDYEAPILTAVDPVRDETGVASDKILQFTVIDVGSGVDLSTVRVYIDEGSGDVLAYNGDTDAFQAPYDGAGSSRSPISQGHSFHLQKTSSWPSLSLVTNHVTASDVDLNALDDSYSFTTVSYAGPTFEGNSPTTENVIETTPVFVSIRQDSGSVNISSIDAVVDGDNALVNGEWQSGFSGTIVPNLFNGFDVTINKSETYPTYHTVNVTFYAESLLGDSGNIEWSFKTRDYLGPLVVPLDPTNGATNVPLGTNIQVQLQDARDIAAGTSKVEIDINGGGFSVAYKDGDVPEFKPGWDGPGSSVTSSVGLKTVTIDPVNPFPSSANVTVRVTALDLDGNPERI